MPWTRPWADRLPEASMSARLGMTNAVDRTQAATAVAQFLTMCRAYTLVETPSISASLQSPYHEER